MFTKKSSTSKYSSSTSKSITLTLTTHHSPIFFPSLEHRRSRRLLQPLHKRFNNTGFYQHFLLHKGWIQEYTYCNPCSVRVQSIPNKHNPIFLTTLQKYIFAAGFTLTRKFYIDISEWISQFLYLINICYWYIVSWFHYLTIVYFQLCYTVFQFIALVADT